MLEVVRASEARVREFSSIETLKQCVLRGLGYGILPRIMVAEEILIQSLIELEPPVQLETIEATLVFSPEKTAELNTFVDITRMLYAST